MLCFSDRIEAGRILASKLDSYRRRTDLVIVALPRGGVPVAFEVAQHLKAPLDIVVVRKIGVPGQPELAMGAIASGGIRILDRALIRSLELPSYFVERLIIKEAAEIKRREQLFRDGHPALTLMGRAVILIDDGAATGSTMLAAVEAVRRQDAKEIVIAVPVASRDMRLAFEAEADCCICLATPEPFYSVSQWYESFPQVADQEVQDLLSRVRSSGAEKQSSLSATYSK
jgi:putative phosphoribosyl transferase